MKKFTLKTPGEIQAMRQAGIAVAVTLRAMRDAIIAGETTTLTLDEIAQESLRTFGAKPALLGYQPSFSKVPYLHATCISINNEVIHGVPKRRILIPGDLVSLDMTASVDGWCADSTITTGVGEISDKAARLMTVTREAMYRGIEQAKIGRTTGDIGYTVQRHVEKHGMNVVREMVGHGIGRTPHEPGLDIPNHGKPRKGIPLQIGMTFCIEPMVMLGGAKIAHADAWTIITADGSWAAHWEHTVAVTKDGPIILTSPPKEDADLVSEQTAVNGQQLAKIG